jgi:hypothetical protein
MPDMSRRDRSPSARKARISSSRGSPARSTGTSRFAPGAPCRLVRNASVRRARGRPGRSDQFRSRRPRAADATGPHPFEPREICQTHRTEPSPTPCGGAAICGRGRVRTAARARFSMPRSCSTPSTRSPQPDSVRVAREQALKSRRLGQARPRSRARNFAIRPGSTRCPRGCRTARGIPVSARAAEFGARAVVCRRRRGAGGWSARRSPTARAGGGGWLAHGGEILRSYRSQRSDRSRSPIRILSAAIGRRVPTTKTAVLVVFPYDPGPPVGRSGATLPLGYTAPGPRRIRDWRPDDPGPTVRSSDHPIVR